MKYGLDIPTTGEYADPEILANLAVEAEQAGWDGFFLWDILLAEEPLVDPWMALAAIATRTNHIRIGAFMTPLARRKPWEVARQTISLDHLSRGRLIFGAGLGAQPREFETFQEESDPKIRAEKLDESLEILSGLWTGESFNFRGKHYQIEDVKMLPKPVQSPRIPIWVAGYGPNRKPFRRAARWDGLYFGVRKTTGERVMLEDVRKVIAYVMERRSTPDPIDFAYPGETPLDLPKGAEIVQPFIEAGVTWWIEYEASREGFRDYRERILSGPPR